MTYRISFDLLGLPRMTNISGRKSHWRVLKKESDSWKVRVIGMCAPIKPPKPLKKAKLTLIRYSSVCPDSDGLVSGFKHIIDGLVLAKVLVNDKFENIGMPTYLWEKAPQKGGRVRIIVEEVE